MTQDDGAVKVELEARKGDGRVLNLEVMGFKLEQQGRDQILIYCREPEALPVPSTAIFQESGQFTPVQEPHAPSLLAGNNFNEAPDANTAILTGLEGKSPNVNAKNFDQEAKVVHFKRIMEALNKAEKLRKSLGDVQKL